MKRNVAVQDGDAVGSSTRPDSAKALGAYYTDSQVAEFLSWWAVRSPEDMVMDPSFGGGVFLRAVCKRLTELGGIPKDRVFGVEIDGEVYRRISTKLVDEYALNSKNLVCSDFFQLNRSRVNPVSVVIGNPPYIRYQRFSGDSRKAALEKSSAAGVRLPELCSSWAPFVVHSIAMLAEGGRLAMVLPMEIAHAKYAKPVLDHLQRSFKAVTFLTFREKLFPDLSEDTLLLIAEGKNQGPARFFLRDFASSGFLGSYCSSTQVAIDRVRRLPGESIAAGTSRLIDYLIPSKARQLYQSLKESAEAQRLGNIADVGIGYVTGANEFFHLSAQEARAVKIPDEFLKPVVRRGRALAGLRFTTADWNTATANGDGGYLLHIPKDRVLPKSLLEYLRSGESRGVSNAYKCRCRSPWFCVPHVHRPDAFLTYMSGFTPRLVANSASAYAPNTLHVVRLRPMFGQSVEKLSALWQTSLTQLSVELEGHALGGGMLKLEPTEAGNVLIANPESGGIKQMKELSNSLDEVMRIKGHEQALELADRAILRDLLGLSQSDCKILRSAAKTLRTRRYGATGRGTS